MDGRERRVDTLIIATGFQATRYLSAIDVVGRGGVHIDQAWNDGAVAHLGVTTAGFPNLFMLYGPNTNNGSILAMIEYQVGYVMRLLELLGTQELAWVDVRPDVMHSYNEEVQRAIAGVSVWQAGCNGYYRTPSGRVVTQWPYSMTEYSNRAAAVDPSAFEVAAPLAQNGDGGGQQPFRLAAAAEQPAELDRVVLQLRARRHRTSSEPPAGPVSVRRARLAVTACPLAVRHRPPGRRRGRRSASARARWPRRCPCGASTGRG